MPNACTIIACNYWPFAKVLADSYLTHHPGATFTVLIVDDERRAFDPGDDRITWRRLQDIGLDPAEVRRLAGIYGVTELSTAVKPLLLKTLLQESGTQVLYLDPDIRVYQSLDPIATLARQHGIVLTPHSMTPYPHDGHHIDVFAVLGAGIYNLGFLGVGPGALPFLEWWGQQTRRCALAEPAAMMFTDQRWIDFVPSLFDHYILKDPGCNVAYWNLHARDLAWDGERYTVDGVPLKFFHFSGYDPRKPWLLSRHQGDRPRVLLSAHPVIAKICEEYRAGLVAAGGGEDPPAYGWSRLPGGVRVTARMRRIYRNALLAAEQGRAPEPPLPFDDANPDGFVGWMKAPVGNSRITRYVYAIYGERVDLQVHFRDPLGRDADAYTRWLWQDGVVQDDIPVELLPPLEPATEATPISAAASLPLAEGLNVAGYLRAELGIGEAARHLVAAIETAGIPYSTTICDGTYNRQTHPFAEPSRNGTAYDVNVLCINADATPQFAREAGPGFFAGRHTAGYWFWELEQFPSSMHPAFELVDEVWTATDFIANAVRRAGNRPVHTVSLPLPMPLHSSTVTRKDLGLPEGYLFLFMFDFTSVVERKNPMGLLEAFTRAFAPGEGPVLVLKSINGDVRLAALERLRMAAQGRPDVKILDGYYTPEQKNAATAACDCYVSLHRSEGLGLTLAEAMAVGKPVIATGYSGNLHFMTEDNSYLVDYARVPVPTGCDPYPTTAHWAEPDLDQAVSLMREVYERPDLARARARRGQQDILSRHNHSVSAAAITRRLEAIRQERRRTVVSRGTSTSSSTSDDTAVAPAASSASLVEATAVIPSPKVEDLDQALSSVAESATLRLSVEGRPMASIRITAQRALFRLLRPIWFQTHRFNAHVLSALSLLARGQRAEHAHRTVTNAQLQALTLEVGRLAAAVERMERRSRATDHRAPGVAGRTIPPES